MPKDLASALKPLQYACPKVPPSDSRQPPLDSSLLVLPKPMEAETASSLEACGKIRRFYFEAKRQGSTPAISGFKDTTPDYA